MSKHQISFTPILPTFMLMFDKYLRILEVLNFSGKVSHIVCVATAGVPVLC